MRQISARVVGLVLMVAWLVPASGLAQEGTPERNKQIVRDFAQANNERDWDRVAELLAPDFVRTSQATPGLEIGSREDFVEFAKADVAVSPDAHVEIVHLLAEDDLVSVWAVYTGTQEGAVGPYPPSGKTASLDFAAVFRIEDGKIAQLKVIWDNVAWLTQLGHMEPPGAGP